MYLQVRGGHILVIGTQVPWIEAILLEKGARHVTTLEYAPIENHHPNLTVVLPNELREMYLNGTFMHPSNQFDAILGLTFFDVIVTDCNLL